MDLITGSSKDLGSSVPETGLRPNIFLIMHHNITGQLTKRVTLEFSIILKVTYTIEAILAEAKRRGQLTRGRANAYKRKMTKIWPLWLPVTSEPVGDVSKAVSFRRDGSSGTIRGKRLLWENRMS